MPAVRNFPSARGSHTGRSSMALFDLLGRRWTLRILWELREVSLTFRELRTHCDEMSPSVLNKRLAEFRGAGIVSGERGVGDQLTKGGEDLLAFLTPLHNTGLPPECAALNLGESSKLRIDAKRERANVPPSNDATRRGASS
jgi:DNA-binding HxlR family transcriptional regulator